MKFSVICFVVTLVLGLLTMGLMGQGLYYPVSPLLNLIYPPLSTWHGDWMWPAFFLVGALWSFGFLISGWINVLLRKRGWPTIALAGIYISVLLMWDLLIWLVILNFQSPGHLM